MSVETAIFDALKTLVPNQAVYPNIATQGVSAPYIVLTNFSNTPDTSICGSTEDAERMYQVDVYHTNPFDLTALRRQVFAALKAMPQADSIEGWQMDYEPDTRLHRCMLTVRLYEAAADL